MSTTDATRIARRYVKALFEAAESATTLPKVERDMEALLKLAEESDEFRHFLTNPLLSRPEQEKALAAILDKMHAVETTREFLLLLARRRRLAALPEITRQFARRMLEARGELVAELTSALPLKAAQLAQIARRLGEAYGKKVYLNARQDAALLGGVVVRIGSVQIDGSLAGKLERLEQKLKAA